MGPDDFADELNWWQQLALAHSLMIPGRGEYGGELAFLNYLPRAVPSPLTDADQETK